MRLSRSFTPTLREDPAEAEIASHRLLLRGAFVRQVAAGIYTFLPMGLRTMRRIEAIIREEMEESGAIEIRMPIVDPGRALEGDRPLGPLRRPALPSCRTGTGAT